MQVWFPVGNPNPPRARNSNPPGSSWGGVFSIPHPHPHGFQACSLRLAACRKRPQVRFEFDPPGSQARSLQLAACRKHPGAMSSKPVARKSPSFTPPLWLALCTFQACCKALALHARVFFGQEWKCLDLRVWTVHVEAHTHGPRLVTTTQGSQTCRKRSAQSP